MKPSAFFVAVLITALPPAGARNIYVPTYDELFAKSDFVVIAQPTRKTRDTNERTTVTRNISPISTYSISPGIPSIGVVTEFECLHVIKGSRKKRFTLHHYREDRSGQGSDGIENIVVNGPTFMSFEADSGRKSFLMFLVRERDGGFIPAVGQIDPDLSIYELR
jgi:hypothetical protein